MKDQTRRRLLPYAFISPTMITLTVLVIYPLGFALYLSVHQYQLTDPTKRGFVGFGNFIDVLQDPLYLYSLRLSVIWTVGIVASQLAIGLAVALLLNRSFKGRALLRGLILLPWVTPSAVVAISWLWMLNGNFGVFNDILQRLGVVSEGINWLAMPETALASVMVATIWQGVPFFIIMLLAGLQSISGGVLDASRVDGASSWQRFRYVTLPLLRSTILITVVLRTIWVANYVDMIYLMTGGGPGRATHTLSVFTFLTIRGNNDFGHGAALSLMLALLLVGLLALYMRLVRKDIVDQ